MVYDWIYNGNGQGGDSTGTGIRALRKNLQSWWVKEAVSDSTITSKMTYFLFTDFVAQKDSTFPEFFFDYLNLLEHFHKGDWKELCYQVSISNTMLRMLNARDNKKDNPNEDFAREFLELFTIGKGAQDGLGSYTNYTEHDIVQAARGIRDYKNISDRNTQVDQFLGVSGYNSTGIHPLEELSIHQVIPTGTFFLNNHDFGEKVFSEKFSFYKIEAWDPNGKPLKKKS